MCSAIVLVEGSGAEVGGLDGLPDDVGFTDPGALRVWQDDRHGMASGLEILHQRVHVGGGLVGRRPVIVHNL